MIGKSNDETNFLHKLLLTNRQVTNLRKAFATKLSAYMKISKTEISKIIQSSGFLGRLPGLILKYGSLLIKNGLQLFAKSV